MLCGPFNRSLAAFPIIEASAGCAQDRFVFAALDAARSWPYRRSRHSSAGRAPAISLPAMAAPQPRQSQWRFLPTVNANTDTPSSVRFIADN
jgi:hypothetical protein